MGAFLLLVAVLSSCLGWPINRWVSRGGGPIRLYAFAANATVACLAATALLLTHERRPDSVTLLLSGLAGIAIVAGYWTIVMACLRIGPASPTVAVYSMSLIWPVAAGTYFLAPHPLRPASIAGVALVLAALGIGLTGPPAAIKETGPRASRTWLALSLAGWVMGGATMTLLMAAQLRSPGSTIHICLAYSVVAACVLAPNPLRAGGTRPRSREVLGGAAAGVFAFANSVTVLAALRWLGPQLVYTLPTVIPIGVMLLVAHVAYGERLTVRGWVICLLGACAVALLAAGG